MYHVKFDNLLSFSEGTFKLSYIKLFRFSDFSMPEFFFVSEGIFLLNTAYLEEKF